MSRLPSVVKFRRSISRARDARTKQAVGVNNRAAQTTRQSWPGEGAGDGVAIGIVMVVVVAKAAITEVVVAVDVAVVAVDVAVAVVVVAVTVVMGAVLVLVLPLLLAVAHDAVVVPHHILAERAMVVSWSFWGRCGRCTLPRKTTSSRSTTGVWQSSFALRGSSRVLELNAFSYVHGGGSHVGCSAQGC